MREGEVSMTLPQAISLDELKEEGCIYFAHIQEGFDRYAYKMLTGTGEYLRTKLLELIWRNGWENSFVDFYYGRLSEKERRIVRKVLKQEQRDYLLAMDIKEEELYFNLTPELFSITFQLSVTETLFSTFYFSKYPCCVWANFEGKYPVFYKKEEKERIKLDGI